MGVLSAVAWSQSQAGTCIHLADPPAPARIPSMGPLVSGPRPPNDKGQGVLPRYSSLEQIKTDFPLPRAHESWFFSVEHTGHTVPSPCGSGRRLACLPPHPRLSLSESRSRHLCCLCRQPPPSCPAATLSLTPLPSAHASIFTALSAFPPGSEKGESSTSPGRPSSPSLPTPASSGLTLQHTLSLLTLSLQSCLPLALCLRETQQLSFPSEGENKSLGVCHANRLRASAPFCSSARHQAPQQCGRRLPLLPHPTCSWHFGLGSALLRAQRRSLQGHYCSCHCFQRPTRSPPAFCSVRPCGQLPPPFDSSSLDLQDISPPLPPPTSPHLPVPAPLPPGSSESAAQLLPVSAVLFAKIPS